MNAGLASKAKGKAGAYVFQQYEGMLIAKEYQPNVKNPNTAAQIANRARFKLTSQLVALLKPILLPPALRYVSNYERIARGYLVKGIFGKSRYVRPDDVALVSPTQIAAAANQMNISPSVPAGAITIGQTLALTTVTVESRFNYAYQIVAYDGEGNILGNNLVEGVGTGAAEAVQAPAVIVPGTPKRYDIYLIVYDTTAASGNTGYGGTLGNDADTTPNTNYTLATLTATTAATFDYSAITTGTLIPA